MGEEKKLSASRTEYTGGERGKREAGDRIDHSAVYRNRVVQIKSEGNSPEEYQSDSSEELQYGPGIVNKLRSKYLSMTLRETQKFQRPIIPNLRRATSLENLLDNDKAGIRPASPDTAQVNKAHKFNKRVDSSMNFRPVYKFGESLKRVRSVEALLQIDPKQSFSSHNSTINITSDKKLLKLPRDSKLKVDLVNDDIIIVENKRGPEVDTRIGGESQSVQKRRTSSSSVYSVEEELPPPDVVKHILPIFEPSPKRISRKTGVAARVAAYKNVNSKVNTAVIKIPALKATIQGDLQKIPQQSAKILPLKITQPLDVQQRSVDTTVVSRIHSGQNDTIALGGKSPDEGLKINHIAGVERKNLFLTTDRGVPVSNCNIGLHTSLDSSVSLKEEHIADGTKQVSELAMDNIRKASVSVQINITQANREQKSYLPKNGSHTLLSLRKQVQSVSPSVLPTHQKQKIEMLEVRQKPEFPKQIGVIKPITVYEKPSSLTEREREKNLINQVKSNEPNILMEDVEKKDVSNFTQEEKSTLGNEKKPGLWEQKKAWNQPETTFVFNFQHREKVPDYIENDGLNLAHRSRSESNSIQIGDCSESSDFDVDELFEQGPPSPCNVFFEGDNILINGKSSIQKLPKLQKLNITFNDEATTTFEYPSESSLLDDSGSSSIQSPSVETRPTTTPTEPAPSSTQGLRATLGSSLASYTPSKIQIGEGFELGVTRTVRTLPITPSALKQNVEEEYLKPAEDSEIVTWSSETASDILF